MKAGGAIRQGIGPFVPKGAMIAPNPFPGDAVRLGCRIQPGPQVHVFGPFPALRQGLDDVLARSTA